MTPTARWSPRGELTRAAEAEQWYRQAAARGHRRAALQLGALLEDRGEYRRPDAGI